MNERSAKTTSIWIATGFAIVSVTGTAHAHGGPPAALSVAAANDQGPTVVVLNEGLAALYRDRWSFLCPRLWGEADVSSGKTPIACSADGIQTWVVGNDDLYAAEGGRLVPQHRPDLSGLHVLSLAAHGEGLLGLRISDTGGSEIVRIGADAAPPLWASDDYWSSFAVDGERLHLARLVNEVEIAFVTLDLRGEVVRQSRAVMERVSARVDVQPTGGRLFAAVWDSTRSVLGVVSDDGFQKVLEGDGVLHGPQASPGGTVFVALDTRLMRENAGNFERTAETRAITCLGSWAGKPYACSGSELYWLRDDGLGERFFHLEQFSGPPPEIVPEAAARECEFQWVLFRNDLMNTGLVPQEWGAASGGTGGLGGSAGTAAGAAASAAGSGAGTAAAGAGTGAAGSSGAGLDAAGSAPAGASSDDAGCRVAGTNEQTRAWAFVLCLGWLLLRARRR